MLLPPDMRDWVPQDDMVHFVIAAVEQMDLRMAEVNLRDSGSEQYPPSMMTALLIYCYAHGIFSSRKIERATYRDVAVRYLSGDTHPDHDTIATFRKRNRRLFEQCFVEVLVLAQQIGVLQVGTVSIDGTKMAANASKYKSVSYERIEQLLPLLEQEVQRLSKEAEEVDRSESDQGQRLPRELTHHEKLKEKLQKAKAEQPAYEAKVEARNKRKASSKGRIIKPPQKEPEPSDQINLSDEDSELMRTNKRSAYIQGYNAQAVVDADGSQLVLGARVSQCASDCNELSADLESMPEQLPKPATILVDSGYENMDQIAEVEQAGPPFIARWVRNENTTNPDTTLSPPSRKKLLRSKRSDAWPWPSAWPARRAGRFTENANKRSNQFLGSSKKCSGSAVSTCEDWPKWKPNGTWCVSVTTSSGFSTYWERIGAQPCHKVQLRSNIGPFDGICALH